MQLWFHKRLSCPSSLLPLERGRLIPSPLLPFFLPVPCFHPHSWATFLVAAQFSDEILPGADLTHWKSNVLFKQKSELISHIQWGNLAHWGVNQHKLSGRSTGTKKKGVEAEGSGTWHSVMVSCWSNALFPSPLPSLVLREGSGMSVLAEIAVRSQFPDPAAGLNTSSYLHVWSELLIVIIIMQKMALHWETNWNYFCR